MGTITAQMVKELRERTGAGMMDCKKALEETQGNIELAIENLRKTGMVKAAKKLDREAKEGRVEIAVSSDKRRASMVELSSETDFVARTEKFIEFVRKLADLALENKTKSVDELMSLKVNNDTVLELITNLIATTGENIKLKRVSYIEAPDANGIVFPYIHHSNRVGVLVSIKTNKTELASSPRIAELAKELALHIAFANPISIDTDEVPQEIIEKEKAIYLEQARKEGKPEPAIPKIIDGKIKKFLQESCLLEQQYIRDNSKTIRELIAEFSKELGANIEVIKFARFEVGTA